MRDSSRRAVLGTTGTALAAALAGCNDLLGGGTPTDASGGGDGERPARAGSPPGGYAAVERWLRGDPDGNAAGTFDGSFADLREKDAVTIEVGAPGNGGNRAFAPVAAVVSAGTEVRWEWTGEGGPHNVVSNPGEQVGASDWSFRSGAPESGGDVTFTRTLSESGHLLYHCGPHRSAGMKGGLGVE